MSSERVYGWVSVSGTEMLVRFDDEDRWHEFLRLVDQRATNLQLVFLRNGQRARIRPSSVDAISRNGDR